MAKITKKEGEREFVIWNLGIACSDKALLLKLIF